MSVDKPRHKNTLWNVRIQTREEAYAPIAAELAAFERHKKALLDNLRNVHERGLNSESFDAEKVWCALTRLAKLYFCGETMKQETIPTGERVKRLRQLARALARARGLAEKALQDDVGGDLFRGWVAGKQLPMTLAVRSDGDGSSVATRAIDEIKNAVTDLVTLESAARTAAAAMDAPASAGRPPILPRDCIHGLARIYRSSTGLKPGRGDGPFARFVLQFIAAVGRRGCEFDSVIEAIKDAHAQRTPSAFGELA
jgi:hypothetical protein